MWVCDHGVSWLGQMDRIAREGCFLCLVLMYLLMLCNLCPFDSRNWTPCDVLFGGLRPNLCMSLTYGWFYTCMLLWFITLTLFCRLLNKLQGLKLTSSADCLCKPQSHGTWRGTKSGTLIFVGVVVWVCQRIVDRRSKCFLPLEESTWRPIVRVWNLSY